MSQHRLYVTATEAGAAAMLERMSAEFEEEGFALATMEVDEKADRWEASIYVTEEERAPVLARFAACLKPEFGDVTIEQEDLPEIDWVTHSLKGLQPVRAGRFLVHGSHDRSAVRPNDLAIEIDAGQAFGTGHHGTTAGCLEMIGKLVRRHAPQRILDLGTGSGVLAIAAAKLANARILATDIDPVAIRVAEANARLNAVKSDLAFRTVPGFGSAVFAAAGPFDLIVANILARPLMRMAPDVKRHLAPGGQVVLSGILASQRLKVLAVFNTQGLYHRETLWRDGWVTLHLS